MLDSYDCLVVGGGPAGSTVAALVAAAGATVLLVEAERHPRYRVGGSLAPECYWTFKRLGVLDELRRADFTRKAGVTFVSHCGRRSETLLYQDSDARDCALAWNVERDRFDRLLFENAARLGVECRDESRVLEFRFDGSKAVGARLQTACGKERKVTARVVADATGRHSVLARQLGLREASPRKLLAAVWGYYRGARRDSGPNGTTTTILKTAGGQSWFWSVPLSQDITSIGVVACREHLLAGRGAPAGILEDELVRCPALAERLMNAELASDIRVFHETPHVTTRQAGEGWLLVGDALGFVDPIHCSGAYLALKSGEMAADAIVAALRENDLSSASLGRWTVEFQAGARRMVRLGEVLGSANFNLDRYLAEEPDRRADLTSLLMGRVFYPAAEEMLDDLDRARLALAESAVEPIESNES